MAVLGPTASGKSALALFLAERLNGEIINCDSVQLYRGLDIGSGKVSPAERLRVPHHLLDVLDPSETSTAGRFRRLALQTLAEVRERRKLPVLAGGAGLYLRALLDGLSDGPMRSTALRARLRTMEARRGRAFLHRLLARMDPQASARIHPNDAQKVIRAVEVCALAGQPLSTLHARGKEGLDNSFTIIKIGLAPAREQLSKRIERRVDAMFAAGLIEELRGIAAQNSGAFSDSVLTALGYREAWRVLKGEMDEQKAVQATQMATRQYAKRQMTWFRRESGVKWFEGFGDDSQVQFRALAWLSASLNSLDPEPPRPQAALTGVNL
ncbi:MAG: tRNA (adenosine(37)-N6)-dimethylallyltransferase MiaA [Terriglobia bacterium]